MVKKTIGIFLDHDLMIRHFIIRNKFSELEKKFNIKYFLTNNKKRLTIDKKKFKLHNSKVLKVDLKRRHKINKLSLVGRLNNAFRKPNKFRKAAIRQVHGMIVSKRLILTYTLFAINFIYPIYNWLVRKFFIKYNYYLENIIKKNKLDMIIHPTVLNGDFVSDLIDIGNRNYIPTIYLMNSWDNCSSRALTHGNPTKYLVWGKDAAEFAKESLKLDEKNLDIIGCAQFEIYKEKPLLSKKKFRNLYKVKKNETLICYAGSNLGINETKHLEILDKRLNAKNLNIKILYRPHPWKNRHKNEKSFFDYKFKNIIFDKYSIKSYVDSFSKTKLYSSNILNCDYKETNTIVKSIDGIFVPFSTLSIECSLQGLPVGLYYPNDENEYSRKFQIESDFYQFLIKVLKPIICFGEEDIFNTITKIKKASKKKNLKEIIKKRVRGIVANDQISYEKKLLNYCQDILKE